MMMVVMMGQVWGCLGGSAGGGEGKERIQRGEEDGRTLCIQMKTGDETHQHCERGGNGGVTLFKIHVWNYHSEIPSCY
jgi:hypothetical protein